jgi:NAD(P)-dependent dehydrogenase (short-subunit alcohol dehydrogenase family)
MRPATHKSVGVHMRLRDKVAIVTGAGNGIGKATALLFADEGAKVVVADCDAAGGERTAADIERQGHPALFVRADISKETDAERLVCDTASAFGGIDILVNNAAIFVLKGFDATVPEWQQSLAVNVIGTVLVTKYVIDSMKRRGGGAVVNLASISSWIAQSNMFAYSATKAAVLQLTRNMAMDLAPWAIRVNCVCPGTIATAAVLRYIEDRGITLEQLNAEEGAKTLLKRIGQPEEVARAILFLASDEASYITGTHLMVDGGYTAI